MRRIVVILGLMFLSVLGFTDSAYGDEIYYETVDLSDYQDIPVQIKVQNGVINSVEGVNSDGSTSRAWGSQSISNHYVFGVDREIATDIFKVAISAPSKDYVVDINTSVSKDSAFDYTDVDMSHGNYISEIAERVLDKKSYFDIKLEAGKKYYYKIEDASSDFRLAGPGGVIFEYETYTDRWNDIGVADVFTVSETGVYTLELDEFDYLGGLSFDFYEAFDSPSDVPDIHMGFNRIGETLGASRYAILNNGTDHLVVNPEFKVYEGYEEVTLWAYSIYRSDLYADRYDNGFSIATAASERYRYLDEATVTTVTPENKDTFATVFSWSPYLGGVTFNPKGHQYTLRTGTASREHAAELAAEERAASKIGDPVDAFTGAFIDERELLSYSGNNPMSLTIHYDSVVRKSGRMAGGFNHNYETTLEVSDGGAALYWRPDSVVKFTELDDGSFKPNNANQAGLTLERTSDGYGVTTTSGEAYTFDSDGLLIKSLDAVGLETTYRYDGDLLTRVENAKGQGFDFKYNDVGHLISVVDNADRSVSFIYDNERLSEVTHVTGDVMTISYREVLRDSGDFKVETLELDDTILVENYYDDFGRVEQQYDGRGNSTKFTYDEHSDPERVTTTMSVDKRSDVLVHDNAGNLLSKTDGEGFTETFGYDDNRNVIKKTDKNGNVHGYSYDVLNRVVKITNPNESERLLEYDGDSERITQVTYEDGSTIQSEYDASQRLVKVVDQLDQVTEYSYDAHGNVLTIQQGDRIIENRYGSTGYLESMDSNGNVTTFTNDILGRVLSMTAPGDTTVSYTYDVGGRMTSSTDPKGHATTYGHDAFGAVTKRTDPDESVTTMTYDGNGNLLSEITGDRERNYTYNIHNEVLKSFDTYDYTDRNTVSYTYNKRGDVLTVEDDDGVEMMYTYDGVGNRLTESNDDLTRAYTYDVEGNVLTSTAPSGGVSEYQYDTRGRLVKATSADGKTVTYAYDALGQMTASTNGLGHDTTYQYDRFGNVASEVLPDGAETVYDYNNDGWLLSETNALGEKTTREYNGLGQVTAVKNALDEIVYSYEYDGLGNIATMTDGNDHSVSFKYDSKGQLLSVTDALGHTVESNVYNQFGEATSVKNALDAETKYTHDGFGNTSSVTNPLDHTTEYGYTYASRLTESVDANDTRTDMTYNYYGDVKMMGVPYEREVNYEYDKNQNITAEIFDRGTVEYGYSYDDELVSQINGRGDGITYEYDDNGNITKEVAGGVETAFTYDSVGNQLTSGDITREYDRLGRVVSKTVGNDTIGYEYDKRGHMVKMTYPNGDAVTYQYDVMGNLLSVKDWNDKVTSYEYDANNRLILTKNWNGTSEERSYDKAGQLVSIERSDGTSESFEYDLKGNIVKENDSVYQYDALNRLIVADDHSYDYDDYGNITEAAHSKYDLVMQYGDDNELTRIDGKYTDIDSDGNLLSYTGADDKKHTAVYDVKNRMTSYDGLEYGYDSENNRVSIGDTNLVVDNDSDRLSRVLVERSGDDEVRYVYGNGLIGSYSDDDFTTHHYDLRGSTVSVSDEVGDVIGNVEYDEYGVVMSKDDVINTRFLYNGQFGVQTDDNGLYHMRARYYNPEIKRFMNRDVVAGSIVEPQTLNRYAYVNGDPVSYHDPFGLAREVLFSDSTLDMLQAGLDGLGFAPVVGNIADGINAGVSLSRGNYKDAFWDTVAILPFGNIAKTGVKSVDRVADYGKIGSSGSKRNNPSRLPRSNGRWVGEPGNGSWFSDNPLVKEITKGDPVIFTNGRPDFTAWSKGSIKFNPGELTGHNSDFSKAHKELMRLNPAIKTQKQALDMLRGNGLTLHHMSQTELQMIPTQLHKNVPHVGSASDMRNRER